VLNKEVSEVQVPEKVGVSELMAKDAEDESLRRYKEQVAIPRIGSHAQNRSERRTAGRPSGETSRCHPQLLGQAAKGVVGDPNDTRRVVITEVRFPGSAADGVAGHGPHERALKRQARGL
jgi:hypothetical protein